MQTRKFSKEEILGQDLTTISSGYWRHGTTQTFVFEAYNAFWRFTANVHYDDGIQFDEDEVEVVRVHQVERLVKVWEEV